ncbi:MAG: radical SAM protein [Spirochaetaceae bacterium]|nr:radical SAM protein [Spirochaetaceae bacterium]
MAENAKIQVVFATILAETSPQALPLGTACVVSSVRSAKLKNVQTALCDISYDEAKEQHKDAAEFLAEKILQASEKSDSNVLIVSFSAFVWNVADCVRTAEIVRKKAKTRVLFVCGGPEITARARVSALHSDHAQTNAAAHQFDDLAVFDYLIQGEGETAFVELLKKIDNNVPGSAANTANNANATNAAKKRPKLIVGKTEDCTKLSSPWLDGTIDPVTYNGVLWELSRGCPYACSYCFESKGERRVRKFPMERLEKEIELFARKKVPQFFVLDPTFNADRERALKLLKLMAKKLPDAHYQFEVRAECMDRALAEAFTNLSCSLQIGLQSANPQVLKNINRSFDRKTFSKKVSILNEYGLVFGFDLIYGLPGDTLPSFKDSIDYALSLYPNHLELFRLSVLPGTVLYEQAGKFGLKFDSKPPYHVQCSPTFSQADLLKAEHLAFACNVFYSAGRAVTWFLSLLHPLKIKPSQFLADFAEWQRCNNCARNTGFDPCTQPHTEIERMQLSFLQFKYDEKHLSYAIPALRDVVRLNGALSRACGEGEETVLDVSYDPEAIFSGEAMDILAFADEACMENFKVRIFVGDEGPDYEIL